MGNPIPKISYKVLGLLGNSKLLNDCLKTGICVSIAASVSTLTAVFTLRGRSSYGHAWTHKTRSETSFGLTSRLFPALLGLSSGDGEESWSQDLRQVSLRSERASREFDLLSPPFKLRKLSP